MDLSQKDKTRQSSLEYRRGAQERAIEADRASREAAGEDVPETFTEQSSAKKTTTKKSSTSKK